MELKGKVALVLGAIKGIGKGIALSLSDAEVKVALSYFDREKDAEFMTGSVLRLDGGYVLGGEKVDKIPEGIL